MNKKYRHVNMNKRVLDYVLRHERRTSVQIVAALGKHISDASATCIGRNELKARNKRIAAGNRSGSIEESKPAADLAVMGRRKIICTILSVLTRNGLILRLARGVYAPPVPKLFVPETKNVG